MELSNCTRCGKVFAKTVRDICNDCYREEEEAFERVYRFLMKKKNREATIQEISKATDVEEELIIKFLKDRRLRTSDFPKLSYPCEQCGTPIVEGRLCEVCSTQIRSEYILHEHLEKARKEKEDREHDPVYYTMEYAQKKKRD